MEQKLNCILINSSNLPNSFLGSKENNLCFYNMNLLKKYAQNNKVKETFYFSKKLSKLSEYLIPRFNRSNSTTNCKNKQKCLLLREDSMQKNSRYSKKSSLFIKQRHKASTSASSSSTNESNRFWTTFYLKQQNVIPNSVWNNKNTSIIRINTPTMNKIKPLTLTPTVRGVTRTEYSKMKCLFRNETIKTVMKNSVSNNNIQVNSASIIE